MASNTSAILPVLVLMACAPQNGDPDISAERGATLYAQNCATCHGTDGQGGGPASLGLGGPPPGLTRLKAKNGGVFPRDYVMSTIDGYTERAHATAAMPEFGLNDLGPLVQVERDGTSTPVPADLLALATYLETIQQE